MNSNDQRQIHLGQLVFSHQFRCAPHRWCLWPSLFLEHSNRQKMAGICRNSHTHMAPLDLHACLGCLHHQRSSWSFCRKQLELPILRGPWAEEQSLPIPVIKLQGGMDLAGDLLPTTRVLSLLQNAANSTHQVNQQRSWQIWQPRREKSMHQQN